MEQLGRRYRQQIRSRQGVNRRQVAPPTASPQHHHHQFTITTTTHQYDHHHHHQQQQQGNTEQFHMCLYVYKFIKDFLHMYIHACRYICHIYIHTYIYSLSNLYKSIIQETLSIMCCFFWSYWPLHPKLFCNDLVLRGLHTCFKRYVAERISLGYLIMPMLSTMQCRDSKRTSQMNSLEQNSLQGISEPSQRISVEQNSLQGIFRTLAENFGRSKILARIF